MPLLDSCINAVYEPGNIGASVGTPPVIIHRGSIYGPDDYPDDVEWSLNFTRVYNSAYLGVI